MRWEQDETVNLSCTFIQPLPSSLIWTYFLRATYFLQAFWIVRAQPSNLRSLVSSNKKSFEDKEMDRVQQTNPNTDGTKWTDWKEGCSVHKNYALHFSELSDGYE